jgi:hypothetical protein
MNSGTLKFLGAATVLVAVGAVLASKSRTSSTAASTADTPVLPVLQERVNDVKSVVIESQDGTVTLARNAGGWGLMEKNGFEADSGKVRELILAMRDARILEEKTANQARFKKLGLEAPDAEGSSSKRVTLKDEAGGTITALLVGNQRMARPSANQAPNPNVTASQQFYMHTGGDDPAVLATGELTINASPVSWLDQQFLDIGRDRIQAARVTGSDGIVVEAARASMDDTELEPLGAPDGMQPKELNGTRPFLDALSRLRFDDVQEASAIAWDEQEVTVAEFFTEHGLRAKVETVEIPNDDATLDEEGKPLPGQSKVWARFSFDLDGLANTPMSLTPPAEPEPATEGGAEGEEAEAPAAPEPDPGPSPAEQAKELSELQTKTSGWAYALPSWKSSAFRMKPDAVFEPIPEPELPAELQPADDLPGTILDNVPPPATDDK